jgi:hypothetical protein
MRRSLRTLDPNFIILPILFLTTFALYVVTLAPSVVPGDPGEYQFIPHILGIAHPPGYAFFTILAKAWTSIVRIGSVAYRSNLLAAAAGAWTVVMVYGMVWSLWEPGIKRHRRKAGQAQLDAEPNRLSKSPDSWVGSHAFARAIPGLFAAAILATSADLWQHSIHANSHIVSAALSATTLFSGLRWWSTGRDRWLYLFAFLAALGVTHHPLLAISAPAYVVFVLAVDPWLLLDLRRLGAIVLALLLGLTVFLYLPLRAGATPFGPSPELDAIIGHATARGIRGNLFHFGLADQPVRIRVFLELLRLQFAPLTLILSLLGIVWLAWRRRRPFLLLGLALLLNLGFIINTVQDVMAYLMLPFTVIAVFAGAGTHGLLCEGQAPLRDRRWRVAALAGLTVILALGPLLSIVHVTPRISLREYHLADDYVDAVFEQFSEKGEGAILLAPWEALTPLYYAEHVEGRRLDPADVKPVFVASGTANPWVEFVWKNIDAGPIYLVDYRPQVTAEGFRLRPVGDWPFYRLEPPPATSMPQVPHPLDAWADDTIHLHGFDLDRTSLHEGETAYLTLFMSTPKELTDYYLPYLKLGDRTYRWTTDSRLNTPWWQPDEVVVERFPVTVPFGTPPGDHPLALGFTNLSQGEDIAFAAGSSTLTLPPTLHVEPAQLRPSEHALASALANLNSRVALLGASASARGRTVSSPWTEPLIVHPGDSIQVWLDWHALKTVDESYTVFVHLIDGAGRPWAQHDYTPMGGAFPTFLWIPRWFEGQSVSDPYKLTVPLDTPPGDYWIEAGMYGMTDLRRVYHFDLGGNLAGDRYVLGPVRVEAQ